MRQNVRISGRVWSQVYTSQLHTASVNSLSFAPHEVGLILASASSDGSIGVISMGEDSQFREERVSQTPQVLLPQLRYCL